MTSNIITISSANIIKAQEINYNQANIQLDKYPIKKEASSQDIVNIATSLKLEIQAVGAKRVEFTYSLADNKVSADIIGDCGERISIQNYNLPKDIRELNKHEIFNSFFKNTFATVTITSNREASIKINHKLLGGQIDNIELRNATHDGIRKYAQTDKLIVCTQTCKQETFSVNKPTLEKETRTSFTKAVDTGAKDVVCHHTNGKQVEDGTYLYVLDPKGSNDHSGSLHVLPENIANGADGKRRICHSYILKGQEKEDDYQYGHPVACAGFLTIEDGKITKINNGSGHYQPTDNQLQLAAIWLNNRGVLSNNVEVAYRNKPHTYKNTDVGDRNTRTTILQSGGLSELIAI